MAKLVVIDDPFGCLGAACGDNEGGSGAAALTSSLAVTRLSRRLLGSRLAMVLVLSAAGALRGIRRVAAVHPTVAVGIAAAIAVLAVVLMVRVTLLSLAMLSVLALRRSLAVALMLGVIGMLLSLLRLRRLGRGRRHEGERRDGGNENGLHVMIS